MGISLADLKKSAAWNLPANKGVREVVSKMPAGGNSSPSVQKEYITLNLQYWCNERGLELVLEHKFHPTRKYRADWAIPALKLLLEYEGLFSEKSRHTTKAGYSADTEKYTEAAKLGWTVFRYTAMNYKNLMSDLNETYGKTV